MVRRRLAPFCAALALALALPLLATVTSLAQSAPPAQAQPPAQTAPPPVQSAPPTAQPAPPAVQPAQPAPPAAEPAPPVAQPSPPAGSQAAPALPNDAFGEEVTMTEKTVLSLAGSGMWDSAFETILDAYKTLYGYLDRQGIKPAGPPMTIYTSTDDSGFQYRAAVPIEAPPANPPQGDLMVGKSPAGKAYRFVHRGSYDAMDATYEAITNFLDEKAIEAKDLFVEEYVTDPLKTPEDKLVIDVYVPVK
jgi:effector-binding domain-containing protein